MPAFGDIFDLKFREPQRWFELEASPTRCFGDSCFWHFQNKNLAEDLAEGVQLEPLLSATVRQVVVLTFEDEIGDKYGLILSNPLPRVSQVSSLEVSPNMSYVSARKVIRRRDQFLLRVEGFPRLRTLFTETEKGFIFHPELLEVELKEVIPPETQRPRKERQKVYKPVAFGTHSRGRF